MSNAVIGAGIGRDNNMGVTRVVSDVIKMLSFSPAAHTTGHREGLFACLAAFNGLLAAALFLRSAGVH